MSSANLGGTVLGNRQFIIFLSTLMVTLPLSLYRNIAQLSKVHTERERERESKRERERERERDSP